MEGKRMHDDLRTMWNSLPEKERANFRGVNPVKAAWSLWYRVCADRQHNDEHPRFRKPYGHMRVLAHAPGFDPFAGLRSEEELERALVVAFMALDGK